MATTNPEILAEYTDLLMLAQRLRGMDYKQIGTIFGISPREADVRIEAIASECMRQAMEATRGDPNHPQKGLFALEDFSSDPRKCMQVMMERRLKIIEDRYGEKKELPFKKS